ncbi:MAG TPA: acetyl-CoA carboxylase biotin carboxylase subunit [Alphaproteobacteria bacterium]|nr:acetyl-CoA carboxylase biotin carboxylase subunit [Alphaproteobacteria bacterium]
MTGLSRVLIANRGEIAVRIIRACEVLGLESVIAVSDIDRESLGARLATRAVCIGPAPSTESYLRAELLIAAALATGCDAVHPGYGFLAENPRFAESCAQSGLRFIGPEAKTLAQAGDKLAARQAAVEAGLPVLPGSAGIGSLDHARVLAGAVGYPVMVKAAAGGGGRGMFVARNPDELGARFEPAAAEAQAAFGEGTLYLERYVPNGRHIEVQILADGAGGVVHLGERDCSVQRRYQKLVEEAPAPDLAEGKRRALCDAAVRFARHLGYENAGTVEFLYDIDRDEFYFMEMNARVQVEHPVSEMITGVDIVCEQLHIAGGRRLGLGQDDIRSHGHAIECRINAESPDDNFAPRPGRIVRWLPPDGEGIRLDSHAGEGCLVPPHYDSLIAKLIVHGKDRRQALDRLKDALDRFVLEGIETTLPFHRFLVAHGDFERGGVNLRWLEGVLLPAYAGRGG